jgi:hypothetical protein
MRNIFSFFLRLFVCLVAAKFILRVFEVDSRTYLLGLTALLTGNVYVIDYLASRERRYSPRHPQQESRGQAPVPNPEETSPHPPPPDTE